jgi:hypothetical protein
MDDKNMELWNAVCKSDPRYLKQVSLGARKFTAIDPQYQVMSATKQFGPVGVNWGWTAKTEFIHCSNGDTAVVSHVSVWVRDPQLSFGPFAGCRKFFDSVKVRMNEDAPKMSITDALTKCLSHLGFNADVFLGEYDGNKYTADTKSNDPKGSDW